MKIPKEFKKLAVSEIRTMLLETDYHKKCYTQWD